MKKYRAEIFIKYNGEIQVYDAMHGYDQKYINESMKDIMSTHFSDLYDYRVVEIEE